MEQKQTCAHGSDGDCDSMGDPQELYLPRKVQPPKDLLLGSHIQFVKQSVARSLEIGLQYNLRAVQLYLGRQQGYERTMLSESDILAANLLVNNFNVPVFTHASLSYNLAGSVKDCELAHSSVLTETSREITLTSWLQYELDTVAQINRQLFISAGGGLMVPDKTCLTRSQGGVVIHPGTYPNREAGEAAIIRSLDFLKFPEGSVLLLENSSGSLGGSKLADTYQSLANLIKGSRNQAHLKVCLDTCHIYGAGLYDLSKSCAVHAMFEDFDKILGRDRLGLIHLNDSLEPYRSKKDRHAVVGQGLIWSTPESKQALHYLLYQCKQRGLPIVLENSLMSLLEIEALEERFQKVLYL